MNAVQSRLVAVSGIDGSGKSTQVELLARALQDRGVTVATTKTSLKATSSIFRLAEEMFGDPHAYDPAIPATLREFTIACDVLAFSDNELAALMAANDVVVWDRSPLCYSVYAGVYGADTTWSGRILDLVRSPDVIVLLDMEVDAALERLQGRAEKPHQTDEGDELLRRVRSEYLARAAGRPEVVVIDADRGLDEVTEEIIGQVMSRLGLVAE